MKQSIKSCLFIAVGILMAISMSYGQDRSSRHLAEELLALIDIEKGMKKAMGMMKQMQMDQARQAMPKNGMSDETADDYIAMQEEFIDAMAHISSWDSIKEDVIGIYADTFTAEELKELIAFYKSPVGRKLVQKQPELTQKMMLVSQQRMMSAMPQIQKAIKEMQKQLEIK